MSLLSMMNEYKDLPGILGGLFLIIGAYSLYLGKIWYSLFFYFFADICWLILSIQNGSTWGSVSICIGILFSTGVILKMHFGIFHKDLKKEEYENN